MRGRGANSLKIFCQGGGRVKVMLPGSGDRGDNQRMEWSVNVHREQPLILPRPRHGFKKKKKKKMDPATRSWRWKSLKKKNTRRRKSDFWLFFFSFDSLEDYRKGSFPSLILLFPLCSLIQRKDWRFSWRPCSLHSFWELDFSWRTLDIFFLVDSATILNIPFFFGSFVVRLLASSFSFFLS